MSMEADARPARVLTLASSYAWESWASAMPRPVARKRIAATRRDGLFTEAVGRCT